VTGGAGHAAGVTVIEHAVTIERPIGAVWAVLEDVRRLPELSSSTVAVLDAPERLTAPGQTFRQEVVLLGRRFDSQWVVTDLRPERCLGIEGDVGYGVRYQLVEQLEPLGPERTRLRIRIEYRLPLGVLGRVANRLGVARRADAEARQVAAGLKAMLESGRG
jgi:uncharacterized membrane protein